MQDQCAVDFDYLKEIGLDKPMPGVIQLQMNDFVGESWVNDYLDELWCKNYAINKHKNVKRFENTWGGHGKVAVLVGASPAVLKHIETLKTLDDNFIIIACNTIYAKLVKDGVRVDYVFAVEAKDHIASDFTIQNEATELIASPFICPDVLDKWQGKKWFYVLGGGRKYQQKLESDGITDIDVGGGNCVSTSACWAYKYLQVRDFILIGTSLCYYDQYYFDNRTTEHVCVFDEKEQNVKAVDMYGSMVKVTPAQLSYKVWLENFIKHAPGINVVNATEDGILGVVPEILSLDENGGGYTIHYLPWINIMPFTMAVEAYKQKLKEIHKNGSR